MVPFTSHRMRLEKALETVHALSIPTPDLFTEKSFDQLLEICIECNEIKNLRFFVSADKALHCVPYGDFNRTNSTIPFIDISQMTECDHRIFFGHRLYWGIADIEEIYRLTEGDDPEMMIQSALVIAKRVLARSPSTLGIVCGSISTGDGTIEQKLTRFNRTVFKVASTMPVFNQMPFEHLFMKIHRLIREKAIVQTDEEASNFFIDGFYKPIFFSGKIWKPKFMHGWNYSRGASKEREIFEAMQKSSGEGCHLIEITDLDEGYEQRLFPLW